MENFDIGSSEIDKIASGDNVSNDLLEESMKLASQEFRDSRVTGQPGSENFEFDGKAFIEDNYGSQEAFLEAQPKELRQELGLPSEASSDEVFERMADLASQMLQSGSPDLKEELLANLGLENTPESFEELHRAIIEREIKESGLGPSASYEDLEQSMHRRSLTQVLSGSIPIDYD